MADKPTGPPPKPQAQTAEDRELEKQDPSAKAASDPAIHDASAQRREGARLGGEAKAKGGPTVLLRTAAGVELEVTEQRWKDEQQTLRQAGYDPVDQIPAAPAE